MRVSRRRLLAARPAATAVFVDTHLHFWNRGCIPQPWMTGEHADYRLGPAAVPLAAEGS